MLLMYFESAGIHQFKTDFYNLEGQDKKTGWSTRKTLQELSLQYAYIPDFCQPSLQQDIYCGGSR